MREAYDEQGLDHPGEWYPPDLLPGADVILAAYSRLHADRPVTLGAMGGVIYGRISYGAIKEYAETLGLGADEFDRFDRLVSMIDADELPRINERANRKRS